MVLYPIAPLIHDSHVKEAFSRLCSGKYNFVVPIGTAPLRDAGAFYVGGAEAFRRSAPLYINACFMCLPEERVCDVNTEEDWQELERKYFSLKATP
jgi:CMP-N-acetylneuraminic acid synthetase